jgi:hypothetical protein
MGEA